MESTLQGSSATKADPCYIEYTEQSTFSKMVGGISILLKRGYYFIVFLEKRGLSHSHFNDVWDSPVSLGDGSANNTLKALALRGKTTVNAPVI
ncbi:hypothetical protein HP567_001635 [Brevibacillus sp. M2.1A]|uniref:hypothetical protein n=1 Tax=Brevibacillus sp. M2.1A TaxID=2738980 RepID=UPI00156AD91B|nr:hypothetical protein [Brevibacillus sp. M2.1A]MCC8433326.1 hypothetical protein [Brevibacillus sp. M2.1A]